MNSAIRVTKPDSVLIIGQDLTNKEDMKEIKNSGGDVGHPIKLNHQWIDGLLSEKFDPFIYKILFRSERRAPEHHYGTYTFAKI